MKSIAASTTSTGREMLEFAKEYILEYNFILWENGFDKTATNHNNKIHFLPIINIIQKNICIKTIQKNNNQFIKLYLLQHNTTQVYTNIENKKAKFLKYIYLNAGYDQEIQYLAAILYKTSCPHNIMKIIKKLQIILKTRQAQPIQSITYSRIAKWKFDIYIINKYININNNKQILLYSEKNTQLYKTITI